MTHPIVGSVPRGDDFFDRKELVENIWARLEHDNVLLVAPRRFGKTGIMYNLLDKPREPFHVVYVNVEHIMSASDFMVELIAILIKDKQLQKTFDKIKQETKGIGRFISNLPKSIDLGGIKVELREQTDLKEHWKSYGERVLSLLNQDNPRLLLIIDEFPIMIDNIAQVNKTDVPELLRWFRAARIGPDVKTRFVVGGSINLATTLEALGLVDTINDFAIVKVGPFTKETAQKYVEAIFKGEGIDISPTMRNFILELVGVPIPYLLAVFLTAILDRHRNTGESITKKLIRLVFEEDLLGGSTAVVFQHYRSRIDSYYLGNEGKAAKSILGLLSKADDFVKEETLYAKYLKVTSQQPNTNAQEEFLRLMYKLENDFYIMRSDGTYSFLSKILRLWWKNHYGFQSE